MTTEQLKQGNELQGRIDKLDKYLQLLYGLEKDWDGGAKCTLALGSNHYIDSRSEHCPSITVDRDSPAAYLFSPLLHGIIDRTSYELEQLNNQLKAL